MTRRMAAWFIGVGFATLVIGILLLGYLSNGIKPVHYIAIVVVIGGIATLFKELNSSEKTQSLIDTGKKNLATGEKSLEELSKLRIENSELRSQNQDLLARVQNQTETIDQFRHENNELSLKLSDQVLKNNNYTIGGDSYCYVILSDPDAEGNSMVSLHHEGNYPLYNLSVTVINESHDLPVQDPKEMTPELVLRNAQIVASNTFVFSVGELGSHTSLILGKIPRVPRDKKLITIHFDARNGHWFQDWRTTLRADGVPITTYKVIQGLSYKGKVLKELDNSKTAFKANSQ